MIVKLEFALEISVDDAASSGRSIWSVEGFRISGAQDAESELTVYLGIGRISPDGPFVQATFESWCIGLFSRHDLIPQQRLTRHAWAKMSLMPWSL